MTTQDLDKVIHQLLIELKDQNKNIIGSSMLDNKDLRTNSHDGVFSSIDEAVSASRKAQQQLMLCSLEKRKKIILALRSQAKLYARELATMAFEETKFGDLEGKVKKNLLVAEKTPGLEILEPEGISGDHGLTVYERAPYGVVGSVTPSTNPTATIINNAISIIAAGNSVVFNVHPRAKKVSVKTVQLLNQAIQSIKGPANLLTAINEPTIEGAQYLMGHKDINLLLITGGPGVVKVAMQSGKRAICAGPGNPPDVVDETADIQKTAQDLVKGASFDNNLPCTCEKEVFVVEKVADELKSTMSQFGAYEVKGDQKEKLIQAIFQDLGSPWHHGSMKPELVGQSAQKILNEIGIQVGNEIKLIIMEVGADHPLVWTEQMMPVLPIVRVNSYEEAVEMALRAEQDFHHSAGIHSLDLRNLSYMAKIMNTAIFIKNGPHYAGLGYESEGYTSFSIGTFTREGLTNAKTFTWERKCVLQEYFRIV